MSRRARAVLGTACGTHFVHDGFSDILYVLLPVWAREFGLLAGQSGVLDEFSRRKRPQWHDRHIEFAGERF